MKWILPAAIAVAVIAGGGWYATTQTGETAVSSTGFDLPGAASAQTADIDTSGVTEMVLGDPDAPVEVIEYASFTCPHCATFHDGPFKQLQEDYIETGQIRFVYREVYFDKYGMWASLIARCAGPDRYFGIVDLIYEGQSEWTRAGSDAAIAEELRRIGRMAGMDGERIESCLNDRDQVRALVAWYQENAEEHDIRSTPSFVIDGRTYNNMSYADFAEILDGRLDG